MKVRPGITLDRVIEATERSETTLDDLGFCIHCGAEADGAEADGVEPDARRYKCEVCGERGVFGAAELLIQLAV